MFNNIGGKIKNIAKYVCYVEIACCIIAGIAMMFMENFLGGIAIALLGSAAVWLGSVTMYGFGHLIENTDKLVVQCGENAALQQTSKQASKTPANTVKPVREKLNQVIQETEAKLDKTPINQELRSLHEQGLISEEDFKEWRK